MNIIEIIEKKRDAQKLSAEEIQFWIDGVVDGSIPNYQTSALLMAIMIQGMDNEETTHLTLSMMHSGDVIDLSAIDGIKVDKHSTGGVGDKTSIILGPIVAAAGAKVPKMSGRGLGHTGGTLDKLESIPHFDIEIDGQDFIDQVNKINMAIVGQTGNLVYADKILYSLRDVTGTVASIPLIASSIMSKKLAGGADSILLDVKYGEGAFMKTVEDAQALARTMIAIGRNLDRDVNAMITNMNQPLGKTIGNALEVYEAALTLQNKGPEDLKALCVLAASYMIHHAKITPTLQEAEALANEVIDNGAAYAKFLEWVAYQKGDISVFDDLAAFVEADYKVDVLADESGVVADIKALELGLVSMYLGAGRIAVEDTLDYKAGVIIEVNQGDTIEKGQVLCRLQSNSPIKDALIVDAKAAFVLSDEAVEKNPLIADVL
ncbi:MAG TPA: thymidine phosphorylase [Erysipelothrix sp.]